MGRARLAHHRRRRPRVVGHRKSPRVSPHRPQRSIRRLIKKGDLIAMSDADMGSSDDRLLKCEEVAAILGSGPRFPYRLIAERRIRFTRVGRHVRIPESALREFIEAGMVEPLSTLHRRRRKVA
jgi:excisionase family DNA binding protein